MKKLTISALVASTLLITACGDSQDAAETAVVGTAEEVTQLTQKYHDEMGAMADSVVEVMETTPGVQKIVSPEGHVVGTAEEVAQLTQKYHDEMKAAAPAVVGSPEEVAAQAARYHEMMESLGN